MKLTSMQLTKKEAKARVEPIATSDEDRPRYPWGLELHLENDALEKLGITLPAVGEDLRLEAKVTVTSLSVHESDGDRAPRRSLSLQITSMALGPEEQPNPAAALYGS